MAHYAYLNGCPSREAAARYLVDDVLLRRDAALEARYVIPMLWLAGFGSQDLLGVPTGGDEELSILCAPAREVLARLTHRRGIVTSALPGAWRTLYDDWIRFVSAGYTSHILLRTDDLFAMDGFARSGARLRAAMHWLDDADAKGKLDEASALDWFANFSDLARERNSGESPQDAAIRWRSHLAGYASAEQERSVWPTLPTTEEIAFAATVRESLPPAQPGSSAAEERDLTSIIRHGVQAETIAGRMSIALGKFAGTLPLGADAPGMTARKFLGGGSQLLEVVRGGFLALFCVPLGALMLYFGCCDANQWKLDAMGGGLLAVGVWGARSAWHALRRLRAILRA